MPRDFVSQVDYDWLVVDTNCSAGREVERSDENGATGRGKAQPMIRRVLLWGDVALYFALLVLAVWIRPRTAALGVGVILASVGFPLWALARIQLGSAFSFQG